MRSVPFFTINCWEHKCDVWSLMVWPYETDHPGRKEVEARGSKALHGYAGSSGSPTRKRMTSLTPAVPAVSSEVEKERRTSVGARLPRPIEYECLRKDWHCAFHDANNRRVRSYAPFSTKRRFLSSALMIFKVRMSSPCPCSLLPDLLCNTFLIFKV